MVTPITPEAKLDVYFSVAYKNAAQITHIKTYHFIRMRPLDSIAQKTAIAIITTDIYCLEAHGTEPLVTKHLSNRFYPMAPFLFRMAIFGRCNDEAT